MVFKKRRPDISNIHIDILADLVFFLGLILEKCEVCFIQPKIKLFNRPKKFKQAHF